jgi:putative ATP-binding cassette transporter
MNIIAFFVTHSRKLLVLSVLISAISGVCNAVLLAVLNLSLKTSPPAKAALWAFLALCVTLPVTRYFSERLLSTLGQQAMFDLRMKLCRQIALAPLRHVEQMGVPRLLAALTDDVPSITTAVTIIPILCVNSALVIGILIYMGILSWTLLAMVFGFMVLGIITYQLPIIKVEKIFRMARKEADALQSNFRGLTQGIKELKMHTGRRDAFMRDGLEKTAHSLMKQNSAGLNLYTAASSWGQVLVFVVIGLIVFLLPTIHPITTTILVGYTLALLYLITPLQVTMNSLPQLSRANVALQTARNLELELTSKGPEKSASGGRPCEAWQKLTLNAITHEYYREGETNNFMLGPISLTFRPGETVFFVGGNGSGKTTLLKLLTGLYMPESGAISMNNVLVDHEKAEQYRQYFSVVFSDFYLFDTMFGLDGADLEQRANEYLAMLQLAHKVQIVDGRFSTTDLSQGQRKRLALLTALLEDRPIYVFDEWAADQDPYFKNVFYLQIISELKARGKTVFVISHDDRYYQAAERIIKLDNGQVVSDVLQMPEQTEFMSKGREI